MEANHITEFQNYLASLSAVQSAVLNHRILESKAKTLDEIAQEFDLSKERVRQVEEEMTHQIESLLYFDPHGLRHRWHVKPYPVLRVAVVEAFLRANLPPISDRAMPFLVRRFTSVLGYREEKGQLLSYEFLEFANQIKKKCRAYADDVSIIPKQVLLNQMPNSLWREQWWSVLNQSRIHAIHDSIALLKGSGPKVKAALYKLKRPATADEISELSGISNKNTRACLARINSIVRVTKYLWAIDEWGYPVYEGIVEEVKKRIKRDGGSTNIDALLSELHRFYDVKKGSIEIFLNTSQFIKKDGEVSVRSLDELELSPLDEIVDGRDENGKPYWQFKVIERYFKGYSVPCVPPEIALALGCKPNDRTELEVRNAPGCRNLSLQWMLSSTTQAWIGRVSEALTHIGAEADQVVRITILGNNAVTLNVEKEAADNETTEADFSDPLV